MPEQPIGPSTNPPLNPFSPPNADLEGAPTAAGFQLATRGSRLAAALLDSLVFFPAMLPVTVALFVVDRSQPPMALAVAMILIALFYVVAVVVRQITLLSSRGQTLGKRWMKIKIVRLNGSSPGFVGAVLLRILVNALPGFALQLILQAGLLKAGPGVVPYLGFIGSTYSLVDILFIFRDDHRCIHDLIAGTRVVAVA